MRQFKIGDFKVNGDTVLLPNLTQAEADALTGVEEGTLTLIDGRLHTYITEFVTADTRDKVNNRTNNEVGVDYTVVDADRNIIATAGIIITFPAVGDITHFEDISVTNDSLSNVTLTSVDLLGDTNSFVLYPRESLTLIKGTTKYLIK